MEFEMYSFDKKNIKISALFLSVVFSLSINAGEYLTSQDIKNLVSGNSISGVWRGKKFKQNVHSDGIAVVNIKTMKLFNIPWRVNDKNEYCEDWGEWGVGCYRLKKVNVNKYLSVRTDNKNKEESIWTVHPGFIDINL